MSAGGRDRTKGPALHVDVIVVAFNSADLLGDCLSSVCRWSATGAVVVVDNASGDGSAAIARQAGAADVIENDANLGFARAVNQGLQRCSAPQILLLNPDARLRPPELSTLSATLAGTHGAAIVAPLLRDGRGEVQAGAGRFATVARRVGLCLPGAGRAPQLSPQYLLSRAELSSSRPRDVDYVYGAAMLLDRAFLDARGGLDERFFLFAEDEDICRQAIHSGRRVVLDTRAIATHEGGGSYVETTSTEAQRLYSTWKLLEKWRGSSAANRYAKGIAAAFGLRTAAAVAQGRDAGTIRAVREAFVRAVESGVEPLLAGGNGPAGQIR